MSFFKDHRRFDFERIFEKPNRPNIPSDKPKTIPGPGTALKQDQPNSTSFFKTQQKLLIAKAQLDALSEKLGPSTSDTATVTKQDDSPPELTSRQRHARLEQARAYPSLRGPHTGDSFVARTLGVSREMVAKGDVDRDLTEFREKQTLMNAGIYRHPLPSKAQPQEVKKEETPREDAYQRLRRNLGM